jgi:hypothetical protein
MRFLGIRAILSMGLFAIVGIGITVDRVFNYTKSDGVVTAVETDCYVEGFRKEIVESDTNTRAYVPCAQAPALATEFGYSQSDIKQRHKVTYRYVSPVDKQAHVDVYNNESGGGPFKVGEVYRILTHKKVADKSQWGFAGKPVGTASVAVAPAATVATTSAKLNGLRGKI